MEQTAEEKREEEETAAALAAVAAAEAAEEAAAAEGLLSLLPSDIPNMPPLSKAESRSSQEVLTAAPEALVDFLAGLFSKDIPREIVQAVVESTLYESKNGNAAMPKQGGSNATPKPNQSVRDDDTTGSGSGGVEYRDLAQECCTTLLAILDEHERNTERERDQQMNMDALLQAQEHAEEQKQQQRQLEQLSVSSNFRISQTTRAKLLNSHRRSY